MLAVDTNVLVRIFVQGDDVAQAARAVALMASETTFIAKTVLLETEWVLRQVYKIERPVLVDAMHTLASTENVEIEDSITVKQAMRWWRSGMDFADALHLASGQACEKFATFDKGIKKSAPLEQKEKILEL